MCDLASSASSCFPLCSPLRNSKSCSLVGDVSKQRHTCANLFTDATTRKRRLGHAKQCARKPMRQPLLFPGDPRDNKLSFIFVLELVMSRAGSSTAVPKSTLQDLFQLRSDADFAVRHQRAQPKPIQLRSPSWPSSWPSQLLLQLRTEESSSSCMSQDLLLFSSYF